MARDPKLAAEVKKDEEVLEAGNEETAPPVATAPGQGKLILAEEVAQGHVSWKSIKLLTDGLGGDHAFRFFSIVIVSLALNEWSITFQVWYMGYWGSQYEKHPPAEVNVVKYVQLRLHLLSNLLIQAQVSRHLLRPPRCVIHHLHVRVSVLPVGISSGFKDYQQTTCGLCVW